MEGNELLTDCNHKDACADGSRRGTVLIVTLTPYALRTNSQVRVAGEMTSHSTWRPTNREVSDASARAPASPKSVQLS